MSNFKNSSYILGNLSNMSSSHSTLGESWLSAQSFVTLQGMPADSLCTSTLYITQMQGNWPHSLTPHSALILKIATYMEMDPGSLIRRSYYYVF